MFSILLAHDEKFGFGFQGKLPWKCASDLQHFKERTLGCVVIMGRKTAMAFPKYGLPQRENIVVSKDRSLPQALFLASKYQDKKIYIIGGAQLVETAIKLPQCRELILSVIPGVHESDVFFDPTWLSDFDLVSKEEKKEFTLQKWTRKVNVEEQQYLTAVKDVIENGCDKMDRTLTGTFSKFGLLMRFSLRNNVLPMLTTKRVFWKGVVEELLWLLKGCTDSNKLKEKGVTIWDENGSRSFLDRCGFQTRKEGDLGPVYGFQWRHSGAKYITCDTDYKGQGFDQVAEVVRLLKEDPYSRRIVMSAWNPSDLKQMALPPCHVSAQFSVNPNTKELSCMMYQRSVDLGLGAPFNIASYSLLTHLLCFLTGFKPGEFVYSMGDYHVYKNHVDPLKEQLKRTPISFPTLQIKPQTKVANLWDFQFSDLVLKNYQCYDSVKMKMAS